jgi:hypothetical protein
MRIATGDPDLGPWERPKFRLARRLQRPRRRLLCEGSVSAAEANECPSKRDGVHERRIYQGQDVGSFLVEAKPEGVLAVIPERLELVQAPYGRPISLFQFHERGKPRFSTEEHTLPRAQVRRVGIAPCRLFS